jgi:hypothetical protein
MGSNDDAATQSIPDVLHRPASSPLLAGCRAIVGLLQRPSSATPATARRKGLAFVLKSSNEGSWIRLFGPATPVRVMREA